MKLAVLSDIHGNWPALAATAADIDAWRPDMVVVNGDVVNDGPSNPACWRYVAQRRRSDGWHILRGNHEEYVAEWRQSATPRDGPAYDLIRLSHWTYNQLNGDVDELAALPERWEWLAPDGSRLIVMHGSLLGNRAGIYPFTTDENVRARIEAGAQVFVTAHTHVPHVRVLDGTQVINVGSVGVPGDGDGRAAYGRLTWTRGRGWRAGDRSRRLRPGRGRPRLLHLRLSGRGRAGGGTGVGAVSHGPRRAHPLGGGRPGANSGGRVCRRRIHCDAFLTMRNSAPTPWPISRKRPDNSGKSWKLIRHS